jgi:hypothetical protein
LYKILDSYDCIYVVMEYLPEGDLFSNITEKGRCLAISSYKPLPFSLLLLTPLLIPPPFTLDRSFLLVRPKVSPFLLSPLPPSPPRGLMS